MTAPAPVAAVEVAGPAEPVQLTRPEVAWAERGPLVRTWPIAFASVEDQAAYGRQNRTHLKRSQQARLWTGSDAVGLLRRQERDRIADLIPLRYARMLASPFTFYRGAAVVMTADLAAGPRTALTVQLCGDAHLSNFGLFASPERRLVFDLNDFDETHPGPFEWDVKRLAVSLEIAGRDNQFGAAERRSVVLRCVGTYRRAVREFAKQTSLEVWYAALDADQLAERKGGEVDRSEFRRAQRTADKARRRDSLQALRKLTTTVDGDLKLASQPPILVPVSELLASHDQIALMQWFATLLSSYAQTLSPDRRRLLQQYHLVDVARRVVGVGSVGTSAWVGLLTGANAADPLVLQAKEAQRSVIEPWVVERGYGNQGRRVVEGQRLLQAFGDPMLGWKRVQTLSGRTRDYYVRQFRDWKGSFETAEMSVAGLGVYGEFCGWTLARAHARSGDRVAIASYLGGSAAFDEAIADYCVAYADKNEADHAALQAAADRGEITVADGV